MTEKDQLINEKTALLKAELSSKWKEIQERQLDIFNIMKPYMPEDEWVEAFVIDCFWGCPNSPFGWCAYNIVLDRAHDNCIFCHEPQERK